MSARTKLIRLIHAQARQLMKANERGLWGDAYREFLRPKTIVVECVFVSLFVVALTILAPLGTGTMPELRRLQYFVTTAVVTFPLCYGMGAAVLYLTRSSSMLTITPSIVAATLVQGLGCTTAVHTADSLFRPLDEHPDLPTIFLNVTAVVALCSLFVHYVVFHRVSDNRPHAGAERSREAAATGGQTDTIRVSDAVRVTPETEQPGPAPTSAAPPAQLTAAATDPERFFQRLSRTVSRDVVYLKMEDHYVDVHTTNGSCLIHMRFKEATTALGDLGLQTHRSHWVARRHLIGIEEHDGRPMVRVTGGHLMPVSRTYLPALRDAVRGSAGEAAERSPPLT